MTQPHTAAGNTAKNALVEPPDSTGPDKTATWTYDTKTVEAAPTFLALEPAALALGVPRAWLKREADAGRIPTFTVDVSGGRRQLFNPDAVARAILDRTAAVDRSVPTPPVPPANETMTKGKPPPLQPPPPPPNVARIRC